MHSFLVTFCLIVAAAADVSHLHNMYLPPAMGKSVGGGVVTTIEQHELRELPEQIEYEQPQPQQPAQIDYLVPPMPVEEMLSPAPAAAAAPSSLSPPTSTAAATEPATSAAPAEAPAALLRAAPTNEYLAPAATTAMSPESEYLPPTTVVAPPNEYLTPTLAATAAAPLQNEYLAPTNAAVAAATDDAPTDAPTDAPSNEYLAPETTPVEVTVLMATESQYLTPAATTTIPAAEEITPPAMMMLAPPQPNYQQYQEELMIKRIQAQQEQQQQQQPAAPTDAVEMMMSQELEMPVVPSDDTEAEAVEAADIEMLAEPKPAHVLKADGYHYQRAQPQPLVY